jgi:hypothetical protein
VVVLPNSTSLLARSGLRRPKQRCALIISYSFLSCLYQPYLLRTRSHTAIAFSFFLLHCQSSARYVCIESDMVAFERNFEAANLDLGHWPGTRSVTSMKVDRSMGVQSENTVVSHSRACGNDRKLATVARPTS